MRNLVLQGLNNISEDNTHLAEKFCYSKDARFELWPIKLPQQGVGVPVEDVFISFFLLFSLFIFFLYFFYAGILGH